MLNAAAVATRCFSHSVTAGEEVEFCCCGEMGVNPCRRIYRRRRRHDNEFDATGERDVSFKLLRIRW